MGTVKPGIEAAKLFGEDHHIPMVRLRDERDPFDRKRQTIPSVPAMSLVMK